MQQYIYIYYFSYHGQTDGHIGSCINEFRVTQSHSFKKYYHIALSILFWINFYITYIRSSPYHWLICFITFNFILIWITILMLFIISILKILLLHQLTLTLLIIHVIIIMIINTLTKCNVIHWIAIELNNIVKIIWY